MFEENYQMLADAVIQKAAEDYFNLKAGFPLQPRNKAITEKSLERFFHSNEYRMMTNLNPDYLIKKINEKAESMILTHTIYKDGKKWYVCKVDDLLPIGEGFKKKKDALQKAADLSGIEFVYYMKIRRRDNVGV